MTIEEVGEWAEWICSIPSEVFLEWDICPDMRFKELISKDKEFVLREMADKNFLMLPNNNDLNSPIIKAYWTIENMNRGYTGSIAANHEIYMKIIAFSKFQVT